MTETGESETAVQDALDRLNKDHAAENDEIELISQELHNKQQEPAKQTAQEYQSRKNRGEKKEREKGQQRIGKTGVQRRESKKNSGYKRTRS